MLKTHAHLINQAASGLVTHLSQLRLAGPVQMNDAMAGMTMDVIGGAAFGMHACCRPSHVTLPLCLAKTC